MSMPSVHITKRDLPRIRMQGEMTPGATREGTAPGVNSVSDEHRLGAVNDLHEVTDIQDAVKFVDHGFLGQVEHID
jgi:hypothetical protein